MKLLLRSLLTLAVLISLLESPVQAQSTIPNAGFETWSPRAGVEAPGNWLTTDDFWSFVGRSFTPGTVTKTAVSRSGAFAIELQTKASTTSSFVFVGSLNLGNSFNRNLLGGTTAPSALPFTARPTAMQLYYQLSGPNAVADEPEIVVLLTRRVNGVTTAVGGGFYTFPSLATNFTLATVPLFYASTLVPDSIAISIRSGSSQNNTPGTILRIDDVSFLGTATATRDVALAAAITVAPNPSPDGRYALNSTDPILLAAPIVVLDATGRIVHREAASRPGPTARTLDLSELPSGVYSAQLFTSRGLVTRKLVR